MTTTSFPERVDPLFSKDPDRLFKVHNAINSFIDGGIPQVLHSTDMSAYTLALLEGIAELGEEHGVYVVICKDNATRLTVLKECARRLSELDGNPVRVRIVASEIGYNKQRFLFRSASQVIHSLAIHGLELTGIVLNMSFDRLDKKFAGVLTEASKHTCLNEWYTGITSS